MTTRSRRGLLGLLAGGALALLAGRWLSALYGDWAFFAALDLASVWRTKAAVGATLATLAFVTTSVFAFANLFAVRHSIVSLVLPRQLGGLEIAEAVPTARLTVAAAVLAVIVGAGFALLPHDWSAALLAWDGAPFNEIDPYLEHDLGFYVAWLPWERGLQERGTALLVVVSAIVVTAYAATPSIRWTSDGLYISTWVRRHLAVLAGLFVAIVGWDWRLDRYERLSDGSGIWADLGADSLFAAFDHRIALPYLAIASFAALPIAAVLVWGGWRGHTRLVLAMLSAMILGGPIASALLPLVARGPMSTPEARQREAPYLRTAGIYTRRAYGVDEIGGSDTLALTALSGTAFASRVSVWDPAALAFAPPGRRADSAMTVAWRASPLGIEGVVLRRDATGAGRRWTAEPLRASTADQLGRPYHAPTARDARLSTVLVHPGATGFALVADTLGRIAAPAFESTLDRLALSWDLQDPRLLFRDLPGPRPRLVTTRDVRHRARRLAPFLAAGPTVLPVVRGDSLYWIVEMFVTANRYPLAHAVTADGDAVHYAKHAATAIVQAQTGHVLLVPTERPDPVMRRWLRRFPMLFTALESAPEWVRRERPPAVDQMLVQGAALARVGFQGDSLGRRRLARPDDADADVDAGVPTLFQVDTTGTLGWALPVDIPWSGRTLGVLVAIGGPGRRTEYHALAGPRWTDILEWLQEGADLAGFGRAMPNMRRGRVQAVPTTRGPAWIQSYYEWPPDAAPKLAGVVTTFDGRTLAGRTLAEALGERVPTVALDPDAFRERVARLYDQMLAAQRAGNWRAYGDALEALGRLLGRQ